MKILAISGSLRKESYNTALLKQVAQQARPRLEVEVFTGLNALPIFDPLAENQKMPSSVQGFITAVNESAGVIISTPEYAHGLPGGLKNALDWVVDSVEAVLKPVAVMSVSTSGLGGIRSYSAVIQVLTAMNWNVVIESSINIPYAKKRFGEHGQLVDELTLDRIDLSLRAFERAISALK